MWHLLFYRLIHQFTFKFLDCFKKQMFCLALRIFSSTCGLEAKSSKVTKVSIVKANYHRINDGHARNYMYVCMYVCMYTRNNMKRRGFDQFTSGSHHVSMAT